eukprot:6011596-Alexandrium_andersonii.AAC.1
MPLTSSAPARLLAGSLWMARATATPLPALTRRASLSSALPCHTPRSQEPASSRPRVLPEATVTITISPGVATVPG